MSLTVGPGASCKLPESDILVDNGKCIILPLNHSVFKLIRKVLFFRTKKFREMHLSTNQLEAKMATDLMRYNFKKNILKTVVKIKVEETAKKDAYFHFM